MGSESVRPGREAGVDRSPKISSRQFTRTRRQRLTGSFRGATAESRRALAGTALQSAPPFPTPHLVKAVQFCGQFRVESIGAELPDLKAI